MSRTNSTEILRKNGFSRVSAPDQGKISVEFVRTHSSGCRDRTHDPTGDAVGTPPAGGVPTFLRQVLQRGYFTARLPLNWSPVEPEPPPLVVPLTAEVVSPNVIVVWAMASAICSSTSALMFVMSSHAAW